MRSVFVGVAVFVVIDGVEQLILEIVGDAVKLVIVVDGHDHLKLAIQPEPIA